MISHMKYALVFCAFTLGFSALAAQKNTYYEAVFLSANTAKKHWGNASFDTEKFKATDEKARMAMAADAVTKKIFVGEEISRLRKTLGAPNSYFFSDTILAYRLSDPSTEAPGQQKKETWDLVFIPDAELVKIAEVKIHKRCCYSVPSWAK
jgi:hypothetical protein